MEEVHTVLIHATCHMAAMENAAVVEAHQDQQLQHPQPQQPSQHAKIIVIQENHINIIITFAATQVLIIMHLGVEEQLVIII